MLPSRSSSVAQRSSAVSLSWPSPPSSPLPSPLPSLRHSCLLTCGIISALSDHPQRGLRRGVRLKNTQRALSTSTFLRRATDTTSTSRGNDGETPPKTAPTEKETASYSAVPPLKSAPPDPKTILRLSDRDRLILRDLGEKIGVKESNLEAWYKVTVADFRRNGGGYLLKRFNFSVIRLLRAVFPEHQWDPMKFAKKPKQFWHDVANQRAYMLAIGAEMGIEEGDYHKWYNVRNQDFRKRKGSWLIDLYKNSTVDLLRAVFPEHEWDPTKFARVSKRYTSSKLTQREFMEKLLLKLGISEETDAWYSLTADDFTRNGGGWLLSKYNGSIPNLLSAIFPEKEFSLTRFVNKPHDYWTAISNQRGFLLDLRRKLGFPETDDVWYQITVQDIVENGGSSLLQIYNGSISTLMETIFPEIEWLPWRFRRMAGKDLSNPETVRSAVRYAEEKFGVKSPEDWYRISRPQLEELGVFTLFAHYGGLRDVLRMCYPQVEFNDDLFGK